MVELALADPFAAPLGQKLAATVELLDAVVAVISDIDIPLVVGGYCAKPYTIIP